MTPEDIEYLEKKLYLPMLIKVLNNDLLVIDKTSLKLVRPYKNKIENVKTLIRTDLKIAESYLVRHKLNIVKQDNAKEYIEYLFASATANDYRKYTKKQLREQSEELVAHYFSI